MRLRRAIKLLTALTLLSAAAAVIVWRMTWAAPAWYRPAAIDDLVAATLAEAVENRIIEESHKVRPDDTPWTLRVRSEQVNAWLASRLPRWLIHEQDMSWPDDFGPPQVRLSRSGLELGLQVASKGRPRHFVLRLQPSIDEDQLYLRFDRLSLGRVAMPRHTLDDLVELAAQYGAAEAMQAPEATWVLDLLAGRESLEPVATLADGRRVRLLDLRPGENFIDLKLQTLPPAPVPDDDEPGQ